MPAWINGDAKPITIDQVAKLAGVSKTTISRYLNSKYEMLSEETRERIRVVIEELDYRPNRIAQSLKARNSRMLGCLVSDISSPFSSIIVKGINSVCVEAGYQLLLVDSGDDPEQERQGIHNLMESQVDGLIINTTGQNDDFILSLNKAGVPMVLADRCLSSPGVLDTVATDNYHVTYQCIASLHQMGYQQVGFFTQGNENVAPRIQRFSAFCDVLREKFCQNGQERLYQFKLEDKVSCIAALKDFQARYPGQRLAVFAINGMTMLYLLQGIQAMGVAIGADFGVCGFDDWGWANLIPPGITTISQDSWMVGQRAAQILIERIEGRGADKVIYQELPNRLDIRGSTVAKTQ